MIAPIYLLWSIQCVVLSGWQNISCQYVIMLMTPLWCHHICLLSTRNSIKRENYLQPLVFKYPSIFLSWTTTSVLEKSLFGCWGNHSCYLWIFLIIHPSVRMGLSFMQPGSLSSWPGLHGDPIDLGVHERISIFKCSKCPVSCSYAVGEQCMVYTSLYFLLWQHRIIKKITGSLWNQTF